MTPADGTRRPIDARQLILQADFDALSVPESTVVEIARQWSAYIGTWLGVAPPNHERPVRG